MTIKVCIAGATGWVGQALVKEILGSNQFALAGAISRSAAGQDIGTCLGLQSAGVIVSKSLGDALSQPTDVVVDYTSPGSVKERTLKALGCGVRVVIGTSGLTASDYSEIDETARKNSMGVIAAGNFSITAALAKRFALVAARYLPSWEIIDYANADKMDAPSGTTRELAEELASVARNRIEISGHQTNFSRRTTDRNLTPEDQMAHFVANRCHTPEGAPIESLTHVLSQDLGSTVVDNTGLHGRYDYTLQWSRDDVSPPAPHSDSSGPSIYTSLQEQLGLKLVKTKAPIEVIVIDHLEKPSAN
jgi:4-hydroxy-tetrahydrodipicolinate reductase